MPCKKQINLAIDRTAGLSLCIDRDATISKKIEICQSDSLVAAPQPPQNLSVLTIGDGQVELDWDDLATSFDTYSLYVKNTSSGLIEQTITGLSVSTHTPTGLTNDVQYEFWVTAVRDGIESAESNHVTATPVVVNSHALSFDGQDDWVSFPAQQITAFPVTIEGWVKIVSAPAGNVPIFETERFDGISYSGFSLVIRGDMKLMGFQGDGFGNASSDRHNFIGDTVLSTGQWYHLAAVFKAIDNVELYVDAVRETETESGTATSVGYHGNRTGTLCQGADGFFIEAIVDEVRFWTAARTQTELADNMNVELEGNEAGLHMYYRCNDDQTPSSLADLASGINGTINGAAYVTDTPF